MTKLLFKEEQKQRTPWIWMVIFPIVCLYIHFMFSKRADSYFTGGDDFVGYIIICAVLFVMMVGLTILFYKMKLTTLINNDGIHILFPPLQKKKRFIARSEIRRYEILEYYRKSKMKGYSLKSKLKQTGKAYTLAGKYGLVVYLTTDKKVLIDTHRREAIKSAMEKLVNPEK